MPCTCTPGRLVAQSFFFGKILGERCENPSFLFAMKIPK